MKVIRRVEPEPSRKLKPRSFFQSGPKLPHSKLASTNLDSRGFASLAQSDYLRVLPKNMWQDRERLYGEALELKRLNNELIGEITQLKTKIAVLEKEIEKKQRESIGKVEPSLNYNVRSLLREAREEIGRVRQQNLTLKRNSKQTKIMELERQQHQLIVEVDRIKLLLYQSLDREEKRGIAGEAVSQLQQRLSQRQKEVDGLQLELSRLARAKISLQEGIKLLQTKSNKNAKRYQVQISRLKRRLLQKELEVSSYKAEGRRSNQEKRRLFLKIKSLKMGQDGSGMGQQPAGRNKAQQPAPKPGPAEEHNYDMQFEHSENDIRYPSQGEQTVPESAAPSRLSELLVYRLKSSRISEEQLQVSVEDLRPVLRIDQVSQFLNSSPFFISNEEQMLQILQFIFQQKVLLARMQTTNANLRRKLRDFVGRYQLLDEEQEKQVYQRTAQLLKAKEGELHSLFKANEKTEGAICKRQFVRVLSSLGFCHPEIEVALCEVAAFSDSLEDLNYNALFERFYESSELRILTEENDSGNSRENTVKSYYSRICKEKSRRSADVRKQALELDEVQQMRASG